MLYYRVKAEYDNKVRYTWNNHHQGVSNGILIGGELYTPKEYKKLANCPYWFDVVEVSKRKVYRFFGARFEQKAV
jgi:hypothetical protein